MRNPWALPAAAESAARALDRAVCEARRRDGEASFTDAPDDGPVSTGLPPEV